MSARDNKRKKRKTNKKMAGQIRTAMANVTSMTDAQLISHYYPQVTANTLPPGRVRMLAASKRKSLSAIYNRSLIGHIRGSN